jgi:FixJ family two-component response regulator
LAEGLNALRGPNWPDCAGTDGPFGGIQRFEATLTGKAESVERTSGLVLVVDDDASVCRALSRLLRSYGFTVRTYGSAAALLADGPPRDAACLVVDVRMPDLGGVELCEQLHAAGRELPAVFVTAHGTEGLQSLALHGAPVLSKPVAAERLVEAIEAARRARGPARPPGAGQ